MIEKDDRSCLRKGHDLFELRQNDPQEERVLDTDV